jgi:hypothetical protein
LPLAVSDSRKTKRTGSVSLLCRTNALGEVLTPSEERPAGIRLRNESRREESWHEFSSQYLCHVQVLQAIILN